MLPLKTAKPGTSAFLVLNKGKLPHDFKIARKETTMIAPNKDAVLKVTLKRGRYKHICTVSGMQPPGMSGFFAVEERRWSGMRRGAFGAPACVLRGTPRR